MKKLVTYPIDQFEFESLSGSDHFESETFEEHADSLAPINDIGVFGIKVGTVRALGGELGKIFGGKSEDKSQTGYNAYVAANPNLPFYPTKDEVLAAGKLGTYENGAKFDGGQPASVVASYDPSQGTFKSGDWLFKVISTSPIKWMMFKGANEKHTFTSSMNAKAPNIPQPVITPTATAVHTSNMPAGSTPGASLVSNTNQGASMVSTKQVPVLNSDGTPQTDSSGNTIFKNAGSGAADLSSMAKNIPGGNTTLIVGAVMVVVIIIILFIANKN